VTIKATKMVENVTARNWASEEGEDALAGESGEPSALGEEEGDEPERGASGEVGSPEMEGTSGTTCDSGARGVEGALQKFM
jgi:hypothetical protein